MDNPTILVIDGDPKNLQILRESLESSNFNVMTSNTGPSAWESIQTQKPEIIISEVDIPEMDGFQLLEKLKKSSSASIPIVFLTNRRNLEDRLRSLRAGVKDYMIKPLHVKEVIARLNMILRRIDRLKNAEVESNRKDVGRLEESSVEELLKNYGVQQRTGVLSLYDQNSRNGEIYFKQGAIVNARLGNFRAEKAVYQMLPWKHGHYIMSFKDINVEDEITVSNLGLMIQGFKQLQERQDLIENLPSLETVFVKSSIFNQILKKKAVNTDAEKFISLIDGKRTVNEIVAESTYDDITALERISKLFHQGFIRPVEEPTSAAIPQIDHEAIHEESEAHNQPVASEIPETDSEQPTEPTGMKQESTDFEKHLAESELKTTEPPEEQEPVAEKEEKPSENIELTQPIPEFDAVDTKLGDIEQLDEIQPDESEPDRLLTDEKSSDIDDLKREFESYFGSIDEPKSETFELRPETDVPEKPSEEISHEKPQADSDVSHSGESSHEPESIEKITSDPDGNQDSEKKEETSEPLPEQEFNLPPEPEKPFEAFEEQPETEQNGHHKSEEEEHSSEIHTENGKYDDFIIEREISADEFSEFPSYDAMEQLPDKPVDEKTAIQDVESDTDQQSLDQDRFSIPAPFDLNQEAENREEMTGQQQPTETEIYESISPEKPADDYSAAAAAAEEVSFGGQDHVQEPETAPEVKPEPEDHSGPKPSLSERFAEFLDHQGVKSGNLVIISSNQDVRQNLVAKMSNGSYKSREIGKSGSESIELGKIDIHEQSHIDIIGIAPKTKLLNVLESIKDQLLGYIILIESKNTANLGYLGYLLNSLQSKYDVPHVISVNRNADDKQIPIDVIRYSLNIDEHEQLIQTDVSDLSSVENLIRQLDKPR